MRKLIPFLPVLAAAGLMTISCHLSKDVSTTNRAAGEIKTYDQLENGTCWVHAAVGMYNSLISYSEIKRMLYPGMHPYNFDLFGPHSKASFATYYSLIERNGGNLLWIKELKKPGPRISLVGTLYKLYVSQLLKKPGWFSIEGGNEAAIEKLFDQGVIDDKTIQDAIAPELYNNAFAKNICWGKNDCIATSIESLAKNYDFDNAKPSDKKHFLEQILEVPFRVKNESLKSHLGPHFISAPNFTEARTLESFGVSSGTKILSAQNFFLFGSLFRRAFTDFSYTTNINLYSGTALAQMARALTILNQAVYAGVNGFSTKELKMGSLVKAFNKDAHAMVIYDGGLSGKNRYLTLRNSWGYFIEHGRQPKTADVRFYEDQFDQVNWFIAAPEYVWSYVGEAFADLKSNNCLQIRGNTNALAAAFSYMEYHEKWNLYPDFYKLVKFVKQCKRN